MKKRLLSFIMSVSLIAGTISVNATSIIFEDLDKFEITENDDTFVQIETEELESVSENSLISFNELETNISEEISTPLEATNDETSTQSDKVWSFEYTGTVEEFIAPYTGKYKLDLYGAGSSSIVGGGNVYGYVNLYERDSLYIAIGEKGTINGDATFNGGGSGYNGSGSGGGATSITTVNRGELKNFENYKEEVIAVAGGAGGISSNYNPSQINKGPLYNWGYSLEGGFGGGLTGGSVIRYKNNLSNPFDTISIGGTQFSGFSFGQGEDSKSFNGKSYSGAGGGGWYGGYTSVDSNAGGGGGSGYIGGMYDGIIVNTVGTSASQNTGNLDNGKCEITYIGEAESSIVINPGIGGTYNNKTEPITIKGTVGDLITLETPYPNNDYTFIGWTKSNGETLSENTVKIEFKTITYTAKWKAPLTFEVYQDDDYKLTMTYMQDDMYNKFYKLYQSYDKVNYNLVTTNSDDLTSNPEITTFSSPGIYSFVSNEGSYTIEAYGAQGGSSNRGNTGGYGGYSIGTIYLKNNTKLFCVVGGAGSYSGGGYNGGGNGGSFYGAGNGSVSGANIAGGGGATHIAYQTGLLSSVNINNVLMIAGGGGGASTIYNGGAGGGLIGSSGNGMGGTGGSQSSGGTSKGTYGRGGQGVNNNGGGGAGYFGGGGAIHSSSGGGGGGSSYLSSALKNSSTKSGIKSGNGKIVITRQNGETSSLMVRDIKFNDNEAPNPPSNVESINNGTTTVISWKDNDDNGTIVYHKVESYDIETGELLQKSDVLSNIAKSGVKGFYYVINNNPNQIVSTSNNYIEGNSITIQTPTSKQYLHIATIDNAGNISSTCHYEIPFIASYTVRYYKMDLNGNYVLDETVTDTATIGTEVIPEVKEYIGFTSPQPITKTVLADGSTLIEYYYERNKYTVTYIDKTPDGKEIERITKLVYYNADVRGSELGDDSAYNAYYLQYKYLSDTSATVTTDGATVYRIFEFCETEVTSNLKWNDNNNIDGFRPQKYKLKLKQNGKVIDEVELPSEQTDYTFPDLPKYDESGNPYHYTFDVDASDRYQINFDNDGNLIIEDYQPANFSVTIPKQIVLDGRTGEVSYTVSVKGTFYYNDTLTVQPNASFTLTDRNELTSMEAKVKQDKTTFTKEDNVAVTCQTEGSIKVNKPFFAGKWNGSFNFDIKFIMQN